MCIDHSKGERVYEKIDRIFNGTFNGTCGM